jgi:hypothetical protein
MQKKKKQHFVWRKYLRQWAPNESIFCLMGDNIFESGLMGVGQERYFYKLKELTQEEVRFITALLERDQRPLMIQLNHGWLDLFNKVFEIKNKIDQAGISDPKVVEMLDVMICNFEEDIHCSIESEGGIFLDNLYKKDVSFYEDDEEVISFIFFICQQYFRTQKLSSNVRASLSSFNGYNIDAMWPVLRHTSATSLGFSLYQDREKFRPILIENKSETRFITGDQPIVNTHAVGLEPEDSPEELEFYYPLTPSLALLFTDDTKYQGETIISADEGDVIKYNGYIHEQSGRQVYASQREPLELLVKV